MSVLVSNLSPPLNGSGKVLIDSARLKVEFILALTQTLKAFAEPRFTGFIPSGVCKANPFFRSSVVSPSIFVTASLSAFAASSIFFWSTNTGLPLISIRAYLKLTDIYVSPSLCDYSAGYMLLARITVSGGCLRDYYTFHRFQWSKIIPQ